METPKSARRSVRNRQSICYKESPVDSSDPKKLAKSVSPDENTDKNNRAKTPRSTRKSEARKASEDHENYSPKKLRGVRTPSTKALESIVTENSPTVEKLETSPRKSWSLRDRKSAPRYSEFKLKINLKDKTVKPVKDRNKSQDEEAEVSEEEVESTAKPTMLFDEDEDVEGQKLYSFKTPKKKDSMVALAQHTPKTPHRGEHTPKHSRHSGIQKTPTSRPSAAEFLKTPKHIRAETKKSKFDVVFNEKFVKT